MALRVRAHVNPLSIRKEHSFAGFENNNPIVVDVGACKGEFAFALAQKFPEKNFILFEIRIPLANKLREKFSEFENVVIFDGDAGRNFEPILRSSADQIEIIYINFPDPWFKEKHKKRRFVNEKFLTDNAEWISAETEFVFQTDQKFMFDETLEVIQESPFSSVEFFDQPPHGVRTDWEEAKVREGSDVWRMKFKKK